MLDEDYGREPRATPHPRADLGHSGEPDVDSTVLLGFSGTATTDQGRVAHSTTCTLTQTDAAPLPQAICGTRKVRTGELLGEASSPFCQSGAITFRSDRVSIRGLGVGPAAWRFP